MTTLAAIKSGLWTAVNTPFSCRRNIVITTTITAVAGGVFGVAYLSWPSKKPSEKKPEPGRKRAASLDLDKPPARGQRPRSQSFSGLSETFSSEPETVNQCSEAEETDDDDDYEDAQDFSSIEDANGWIGSRAVGVSRADWEKRVDVLAKALKFETQYTLYCRDEKWRKKLLEEFEEAGCALIDLFFSESKRAGKAETFRNHWNGLAKAWEPQRRVLAAQDKLDFSVDEWLANLPEALLKRFIPQMIGSVEDVGFRGYYCDDLRNRELPKKDAIGWLSGIRGIANRGAWTVTSTIGRLVLRPRAKKNALAKVIAKEKDRPYKEALEVWRKDGVDHFFGLLHLINDAIYENWSEKGFQAIWNRRDTAFNAMDRGVPPLHAAIAVLPDYLKTLNKLPEKSSAKLLAKVIKETYCQLYKGDVKADLPEIISAFTKNLQKQMS